MHRHMPKRTRGFSLIELVVAMALGLVLLGAASQLFKAGMTTSSLVSNRTEVQQNVRAAMDLISKDVSMAGAGLPPGGMQLPTNAGSTLSRIGCDQTGKCYISNNKYANGTVGSAPATTISNYMFGVIPGPGNGMELGGPTTIAATGSIPDSITSIYVDYAPQYSLFTGTFADNTGTQLILAAPSPMPATVLPATDAGTGIKVGDLMLVTTSKGSAIGEVTTVSPFNVTGATLTFANLDALNVNQSGAASSNMKSIVVPGSFPPLGNPLPAVTAQRVLAITYFVEVPAVGSPRLMRQVNGNPPQPVADNIIDMQFTYDLCDTGNTGGTCATTTDPLAVNQSPTQIHKVNIQLMAQSLVGNGKNWQSMQLSSAVSTRNLTFKDRYQ
jgi:prepilin-type N-terminal cleavage/methylation domain-containing protein